MDGGNHYSNDESIIRNTLNTNQDSNNMFDVQSSLQDSKTIHELRTVGTTPQQQLFGKPSSSFNTTSLVLPLNGLNYSSTTTSTIGGGTSIPSFNVSSTISGRQYVSDTTSVQTLDSSKNRIGPTEYQLMMDSHKDDNHLLIQQHQQQQQQQQQLVSSNNSNPNQLVYNSNTSSMSNVQHQLGFQATAPTHVGSGGQTVIQPSNNESLLLSNVSSHLSNSNNMFISSSSQSANSIHFNTKQSMSNLHSTTSEGIFVPNSNTLVSNNNTILHVNELLSNNQKNMQNGSLPSSSMEQQHQPLNANNNTIGNSTNANIPFQINQLANFPNATLHVHQQQLNANIPKTLQMVTNQTNISNVNAFTPGNSNSMNNYLNQIGSLEVTCGSSGGMQEETMLKLDLEDFVKTLNSEDYRAFNVSNNNNSNVNNLQNVQISIPSTLSSNVSHHHLQQQQQQQHANPTPNFVPSSNLLNNPNLSNNANNNLLYILPPQQMHLQHQQSIMYPRIGALNLGSTSSHVSSHSISNNQPNNITHQNITPASIVKFIPSQITSVNPSTLNSSIIPPPQVSSFSTSTPPQHPPPPPTQRSNSTPNTTNSGNIVNNFEPHKEFVIHENEYDRKKAPKSKKRQSVDYCNQKKMEFKMEITKQPPAVVQIVTSSSSVLTSTVTSPKSNATPTGQNINDFDEDPQEENK